jgi:hypothetical protein
VIKLAHDGFPGGGFKYLITQGRLLFPTLRQAFPVFGSDDTAPWSWLMGKWTSILEGLLWIP